MVPPPNPSPKVSLPPVHSLPGQEQQQAGAGLAEVPQHLTHTAPCLGVWLLK